MRSLGIAAPSAVDSVYSSHKIHSFGKKVFSTPRTLQRGPKNAMYYERPCSTITTWRRYAS